MKIARQLEALTFGSLTILGGYFLCMLLMVYFGAVGAPHWGLVVVIVLAVLLAALSGFVGATFAPSRPLVNGTLGAFVGTSVLLAIFVGVAPDRVTITNAVGFFFVIPLAFLGALVYVYIWPRQGP